MAKAEASAPKGVKEPTASIPIGIAMGGGGAYSAMHAGVLAALEEHGITPSVVAGTSGGAFAGAFYAAGETVDAMRELATRLRWHWLRRRILPVRALASNDRMGRWLSRALPCVSFDDMVRPFAAVATDVCSGQMVVLSGERAVRERPSRSIGAGHEVAWESCGVPDAVRASCALPIVFEPVRVNDRYLVDGALVNMVPTTVARSLGARFVIGVDIVAPPTAERSPRTIFEYAVQTHRIGAQWAARNRRVDADILIRPTAGGGEWNDMSRLPLLIEEGYAEAARVMPMLKARLCDAIRRDGEGSVPSLDGATRTDNKGTAGCPE